MKGEENTMVESIDKMVKSNDTISKKQAIEALIAEANTEGAYGYLDAKSIEDCLANMPPAEPERKTGRWIKPTGMMPPEYHGHYECSECGAWAMCTYHKSNVKLTRYCPGCGSKMENANESN